MKLAEEIGGGVLFVVAVGLEGVPREPPEVRICSRSLAVIVQLDLTSCQHIPPGGGG